MQRLHFDPRTGNMAWDQTLAYDLFSDFDNVFLIPGEYEGEHIDKINAELNKYPYVVVLVMSDEQSLFPVEKLNHPKMKVWIQYPKDNSVADHFLPAGYSPGIHDIKRVKKTLDWFWGGQVTHEDRYELVQQLRKMGGGQLIESKGFTQGGSLEAYLNLMAKAKIVPCPRGSVSPDTMRMYDALELGCVPVVRTRDYDFYTRLLGEHPFPCLENWSELANAINIWVTSDWAKEQIASRHTWWQHYKAGLIKQMAEDIEWLQS